MTDYEKAHGGNCGTIVFSGLSLSYGKNLQNAEPDVRIVKLRGTSSECGNLYYKAKITYPNNRRIGIVKQVEILEKKLNFHETQTHPLPRARFERRFVWLLQQCLCPNEF